VVLLVDWLDGMNWMLLMFVERGEGKLNERTSAFYGQQSTSGARPRFAILFAVGMAYRSDVAPTAKITDRGLLDD